MATDLRHVDAARFAQIWNADQKGTLSEIHGILAAGDIDDAYILGRVAGASAVSHLDRAIAPTVGQGDLDFLTARSAFIAGYWEYSRSTPCEEIVALVDKALGAAGNHYQPGSYPLIMLGVALLRHPDTSWEARHPIRQELSKKLRALKTDLVTNQSHLTHAIELLDKIP